MATTANLFKLREKVSHLIRHFNVYDNLPVDLRTNIFLISYGACMMDVVLQESKFFPLNVLRNPGLTKIYICWLKWKISCFRTGIISGTDYRSYIHLFCNQLKLCKSNYYRDQFDKLMYNVRKSWNKHSRQTKIP